MLSLHCAPSILSVCGGLAAENGNHFSISSFVFLCYLPLTYDSAYLDWKLRVWGRTSFGLPGSCRASCRRGGIVFFLPFFCLRCVCLFFMWNAHCQAKTAATFARCDLTRTNTRDASREDTSVQSNARIAERGQTFLFFFSVTWRSENMTLWKLIVKLCRWNYCVCSSATAQHVAHKLHAIACAILLLHMQSEIMVSQSGLHIASWHKASAH